MVSTLLVLCLAQAHPILTLSDALSLAERQNPNLEAARARFHQAETLGAQAWSGYLPQLAAQGGYQHNNAEATLTLPTSFSVRDTGGLTGTPDDPRYPGTTATTSIAVPSNVISVPIQVSEQVSGQITLRQAILAPELFPAIKSAALGQRASELSLASMKQEVLYAVERSYLGAATLRQSIAVQEQLLTVRQSFERDAQARQALGDVGKPAALRAGLDRARAQQELVRARNAYSAARSSLAALLARPADFEVEMPNEDALSTPIQSEVPADALAIALDNRPDLAAARVGVEAANQERNRLFARYSPVLVAVGNLNASNVVGFTGKNVTWNAGLALSWNIFDGGLREAQLRESSAKIVEASSNARASEEKVKDEVRRALLDLDTAKATVVSSSEQASVARETAQLVAANFVAGAATYLEVTDANGTLSGAELNALSESLNLRLARLALVRAMGRFEPTRRSSEE